MLSLDFCNIFWDTSVIINLLTWWSQDCCLLCCIVGFVNTKRETRSETTNSLGNLLFVFNLWLNIPNWTAKLVCFLVSLSKQSLLAHWDMRSSNLIYHFNSFLVYIRSYCRIWCVKMVFCCLYTCKIISHTNVPVWFMVLSALVHVAYLGILILN